MVFSSAVILLISKDLSIKLGGKVLIRLGGFLNGSSNILQSLLISNNYLSIPEI